MKSCLKIIGQLNVYMAAPHTRIHVKGSVHKGCILFILRKEPRISYKESNKCHILIRAFAMHIVIMIIITFQFD